MLDDSWSVGAIDFKLGSKNLCTRNLFRNLLQTLSKASTVLHKVHFIRAESGLSAIYGLVV